MIDCTGVHMRFDQDISNIVQHSMTALQTFRNEVNAKRTIHFYGDEMYTKAFYEALVHPVMSIYATTTYAAASDYGISVMIVGGWSGATLKEVLKYPTASTILVLVPYESLGNTCRNDTYNHQEQRNDPAESTAGCSRSRIDTVFDDPRVTVLYYNANKVYGNDNDHPIVSWFQDIINTDPILFRKINKSIDVIIFDPM
jgi:hypothetical protein